MMPAVCDYRRSCFPAETAPRTERRAAPHHRLCVSHPHTVSDTTQHQPSQHPHLAARRTRSTSSSKHPFHNCLPSSAHRRHQACSFTALLFASARIIFFSLLHLSSPRWFYVLIPFCEGKTGSRRGASSLQRKYSLIKQEIW